MKVATICGSVRSASTTAAFLSTFDTLFLDVIFDHIDLLPIPFFHPDILSDDIPEIVDNFKIRLKDADAVIIATPAYLHNIPAVLKNALEWTTQSGEFYQKKVLPIAYTPSMGRGDNMMKSLLFSLKAMDANVVTHLELDHNLMNNQLESDAYEILAAAIELLK